VRCAAWAGGRGQSGRVGAGASTSTAVCNVNVSFSRPT